MISVRICSFEVRPLEVFIRQHIGRQVRFQVSAQPLGKKAAGLIEKETNEHRTLNVQHRTSNECILSIIKRLRTALPSFEIRYSLSDILRFAV